MTRDLEVQRALEVGRYARLYARPGYGLGERRRQHILQHLERLPRGSLLDVSTGRGEVVGIAQDMGFFPVHGTEAVSSLCDGDRVRQAFAHALPFGDRSFDTVTMFDVMEHLLPVDTRAACREMARVARRRVLLTVHNGSSHWKGEPGDLHINRRASYEVWHEDLSRHFAPFPVVRHGAEGSISEMFEVILDR